MSTSLPASTVALATTAPEESLTTPESVLCAKAMDGNKHENNSGLATNFAQFAARLNRACSGFISPAPLDTNV